MALLPTGNLENSPPLTHVEFPNTGIAHNVKKNHIPLILPPISSKESLTNTNFPKFWFSLENLNVITGKDDTLNLFSFKKMSTKYSSMNSYGLSITALSSKNDDPCSWFCSHTHVRFLEPALHHVQPQRSTDSAFHHSEKKSLLEGWAS